MGFDEMSAYDRTAWDACLKAVYDSRTQRLVPSRVRELTGKAGKAIAAGYEKVPGHEQADWVMEKAFDGGMALTFRPALRTVRPESVVRRVSKRHPSVENLSDLRGLSLEECDELRRSGLGWTIGSAAEGAATSLMVTGAEVSATVSGGVTIGVAAGAIAADVTTTMAVMGRSIGVVASTYGYDVRQPEEELFALGVLSLASANTLGGKAAAMASLSRLTQQMMRRATWEQLKNHLLVNVIDRAYAALGGILTKRKLAQAVPVAGAVINASVNAGLTHQTFRRAEAVYRLRFLSEKYGIDPDAWRCDVPAGSDGAEDVVQVDEELEAEIGREQGSEPESATHSSGTVRPLAHQTIVVHPVTKGDVEGEVSSSQHDRKRGQAFR